MYEVCEFDITPVCNRCISEQRCSTYCRTGNPVTGKLIPIWMLCEKNMSNWVAHDYVMVVKMDVNCVACGR